MQHFETIMEAIDWLKQQGFTEEFYLKENGLWLSKLNRIFSASEISIVQSIKLESTSDPDYTSFVFAVEKEDGSLKGYFVDAPGSYAAMKFSGF